LTNWLRTQGKVRAQQGRCGEAQQAYTEAATLAHAIRYPYAEAAALYESGVLQRQRGNLQQARSQLEGALVMFQCLGARPNVEWTERALHGVG
jgi:hypothetical protein